MPPTIPPITAGLSNADIAAKLAVVSSLCVDWLVVAEIDKEVTESVSDVADVDEYWTDSWPGVPIESVVDACVSDNVVTVVVVERIVSIDELVVNGDEVAVVVVVVVVVVEGVNDVMVVVGAID